VALGTVVHDFQTFDLHVNMPGLNLRDLAFIDGIYRAQGMYTHPNEAAGIVLLCAPLIIGLVEERRLPPVSLLALVAIVCTVFYVTKSRSQMAVVILLVALWALRNAPQLLMATAVAGMLGVVAGTFDLLPGISGDVIADRLFNSDIDTNVADRFTTIAESFAIALQYPFGAGSIYVEMLERETGLTATHNAFLQLAVMGGLPLMLFVVVGLLRCGCTVLTRTAWRVEGWLALYLICIFNIENYFYSAEISVMTQFVVAVAWARYRVPAASQAPAPALPALGSPRRVALGAPSQRGAAQRIPLLAAPRKAAAQAGE
jgi:hypothetical protein